MATYDVKIDEKGRMTFEPGLAQSAASLEAYPAAKKMARVAAIQYTLPLAVKNRVVNHVRLNDNCCCCACFNITAVLLCCIPYAWSDAHTRNSDRDPALVRIEVQRILDSEAITPDEYRIVEHFGSTDTFNDGRTVLKIFFSIPGMTEL